MMRGAKLLGGVLGALVLGLWVAPAQAQDVTAEVKTWQGQSLRLAQPSLEVFFMVPAKPKEGAAPATPWADPVAAPPVPGATGSPSSDMTGVRVTGGIDAMGTLFAKGAPGVQATRRADTVTLYRGGAATQVPVASISSLTFSRQPVKDSTLPPYVTAEHIRYAATAVLMDGSRVDGDYVNLGTTILRGSTPQGHVDIPWQEIESVRFQR